MSVIRVNKSKDYTVMSNYHFRDKRLSLKAKGLLSQMLSLPQNWDYTIKGLAAINKENETAIKTALNELKDGGYLSVTKLMPNETESGRIEYIYDIYENPQYMGLKIDTPEALEKLDLETQQVEKQGIENLGVENPRQYNTKELNTDNKVYKNKINKETIKSEFERLWKEYPRKQGKEKALQSYIRARKEEPEDKLNEYIVLEGIKRYTGYIEANKIEPRFIKQGSTWFNQKGWEDEYYFKSQAKAEAVVKFDDDLYEGF